MDTKTVSGRHGTFTIYSDDKFVGRSLELYGEYSPDEISVFDMVLRKDDLSIEVGANIGALTIPMAQRCEQVLAFEPIPENYELLVANSIQNNAENIHHYRCAVGAKNGLIDIPDIDQLGHANYGGIEVGQGSRKAAMRTLDSVLAELKVERKIKFIKIDVEGSELGVLQGAEKTILNDKPILYIENDREEKSAELIGWLIDHNYRCFWHRPPLFYHDNFNNNKKNVFGDIISQNMICFDSDSGVEIDRLDEVADHRVDDQMYERELARMMKLTNRNPDDLEARFKAAHFANLDGRVVLARRLLKENLSRNPGHIGTLAILGCLDLQGGNFRDGWPAYELRYQQKAKAGFGFRPHDVPQWDGEPTDERVLIWSEQGFGDSIMFVRFMDEVLKRAPRAIIEVQPQLFELFETSQIVPTGRLFRLGRSMPEYAFHCSLPSLPATLGIFEENKLKRDAYLFADQAMVAGWRKRDTPRIGVCCKGGAASERAYSRDMPAELMEPIAAEFGPFMTLANEGQWESFADTAAAIAALDLVLTVDTSIAHLSGALGVPTWLMLSSDPDWRWQRLRSDSPWYPSMRIFRQGRFMNWHNVLSEIKHHLQTRQASKAA